MCACQYTAGSPGYKALAKEVQDWEHQPNCPAGRLFYLALPPYVYPEVNLSNWGLASQHRELGGAQLPSHVPQCILNAASAGAEALFCAACCPSLPCMKPLAS